MRSFAGERRRRHRCGDCHRVFVAVKIKEWLNSGHSTTDLDNAFVWVLVGIIGAAVVCAATVQILVRLFVD